eukprot:235608-Pelagomonas_calceolata.AAC.4
MQSISSVLSPESFTRSNDENAHEQRSRAYRGIGEGVQACLLRGAPSKEEHMLEKRVYRHEHVLGIWVLKPARRLATRRPTGGLMPQNL